ncbi:hypothetical protein FRC11_003946 [Ceratobasidium sp. 423]|nr:hypothetical protein FRC11_003946 [Ceratobasidium sp. 423]
MQLAYYQSSQVGDTQPWLFDQRKVPYDQSCTRVPVRSDSLLYTSELADPNSNLELPGQELAMPYPAYSSSSGYPMASQEGVQSNGMYYHRETVATASSHVTPDSMYGSPTFIERRRQLDPPSETFSHSWSSGGVFQVPPSFADAHTSVRYSPFTVKSQRPINGQDIGTDTPPSPLSLPRSKRSSTSPSPGPLTPAIGHISLQTELYTAGSEPRPTSSSLPRNLNGRNEEVDPDRPYPCNSSEKHHITAMGADRVSVAPMHARGTGGKMHGASLFINN